MSVAATGPIGFRWDDDADDGDFVDEDWGDGSRRDLEDAMEDLWRPTETPAPYTNFGAEAVDVSAPGGSYDTDWGGAWDENYYDLVLSTVFSRTEDGGYEPNYGWKSGTSMATPNVAGTAALVASRNRGTTPAAIRAHLQRTARDVGDATYHGSGHLDTEAAVETPLEEK